MEAKDRLIPSDVIIRAIPVGIGFLEQLRECAQIAVKDQDKISFKAGMEEVVEFVNQTIPMSLGIQLKWQAFLRKMGIEER